MAPRGGVRLVEVAALARVSVSTASRALSRPELVRASTRERVEVAARELGYVPNALARWLITGRTAAIATIIPEFTNPHFATISRAIDAAARDREYEVVVMESGGDATREFEITTLAARWAAGLILCEPRRAYTPGSFGVPAVYVNRRVQGAHCVVLDQRNVVDLQIGHLRALGHERIAWVNGPKTMWSAGVRLRHVRRLSERSHIRIVDDLPPTYDGGVELAEVLDDDVTAVAAFTDRQAVGFLSRAPQLGISVPDDVSLVGVNDMPVARFTNPPLTTVHSPTEALGHGAVSLLVDHIEDGRAAILETLRGDLVERASTAPPNRVAR